jgi:transcriptional regulator with XRE-family HTH domain
MNCAYCNGKAELIIKKTKKIFRKEEFEIFEHYYKCQNCSKEFTTDEIDNLDVIQVYNQYREKYSIPFPEQLTSIREKYNLSAAKMSEIIGFGPNQYRLYESGDIPTESQGALLGMIFKIDNFIDLINKRKSQLKDYEKIINYLKSIKEKDQLEWVPILFDDSISPNRNTGYKVPSLEKFANMVLYLIQEADFKVRLNKYLFYSDFLNYKTTGHSISGYDYQAIQLGPVPDQYGTKFDILKQMKYIDEESVLYRDNYFEKFIPLKGFDKSLFTEQEIASLDMVIKKMTNKSQKEIVDLSHQELGWIQNQKLHSIISY